MHIAGGGFAEVRLLFSFLFSFSILTPLLRIQYALAREDDITKRKNIPPEYAGGSGIVFGTAWFALFANKDDPEEMSKYNIFGKFWLYLL
jgi:hypothetical protein